MSGSITEINHTNNAIFSNSAFRKILASEFMLQECCIDINTKDNHEITFPAFIKHKRFGRKNIIIGAAFDKTGYPISDANLYFPEIIDELLHKPQIQSFTSIELRTTHKLAGHQDHSDKIELGIHLHEGIDVFWKQLNSSTRRQIRALTKKGFYYRCINNEKSLADFYDLYVANMRSVGSLAHSKEFFAQLLTNCPQHVMIFLGYLDNKPVVSSFNFISEDEIYGAWGGIAPEFRKHNVFLGMLWSITEYASNIGCLHYNLGRSSFGSTQYQFKKKLANYEQRIYYYQLKPLKPAADKPIRELASRLLKKSPPWAIQLASRAFLHRFY